MSDRFTFQPIPHGSGGFAKVIRGRDNFLDRDIAVKILDPLVTTEFSESDQERFRREARTLAKMSHTNVPAIYDVDFSNGRLRIIFQFINGKNLREIINEAGAVPISTARQWFHQISSALDHAHQLNIIHRDVKPENIVITDDRESAYLVDFGIALSSEDTRRITRSGYVIGTPGYMSPEQQSGEEVDGRSDVYSLAVTFYETLAGHPIRQALYEPLSTINEAIPPQIDDMILGCLEPRDRRLDSARLFSSQLAGAMQVPTKPFSDVLSHGKLHELALSLDSMTADEITRLPAGQRDLLIAKITDIVTSNNPSLEYPSERFLELMVTRGIFLPKDDFRDIVTPAVSWGFERKVEGRPTRRSLRAALEEAAFISRGDSHRVVMEEFTKFLGRVHLDNEAEWYLHEVREVIIALMANPACVQGSAELKSALRQVNQIQRSRD